MQDFKNYFTFIEDKCLLLASKTSVVKEKASVGTLGNLWVKTRPGH